ncbi:ExbD/TolR family protein [Devosia nitrariae]|uniref:Biopolymer transporter ExbD n=1 Tax=Devosia nitrariae TaxID=2071872 RepID=A0ABQ5WE31_9HYPH|nr:biopolymer transporter ExbD [Devosia nitrariae]GLQ58024.1 hypothetical protein GCM10010862_52830 [Devosia nitrariae]
MSRRSVSVSLPRRRRDGPDFALPMINVIFLMMLYFLVAGTITQRDELAIVPPLTQSYPPERLPRPLLVIVDTQTVLIDGRPLERGNLAAGIQTGLNGAPGSQTVNILAPRSMAADTLLDVAAELGAAGIGVRIVSLDERSAAAGGAP